MRSKPLRLSVGDRIAIVGLLVTVLAAIPAYVVWFASGHDSTHHPQHKSAPATADHRRLDSGQIAGGAKNVLIADVTRGTGFRSPQHAEPCDELEYRARLYNPGPTSLNRVRIAASINTLTRYTTMIPTIVVYTPDGAVPETAFQPRIIVPTAQTQEYVGQSTQILNSAGHVIRTSAGKQLADEITASGYGIPIGSVKVGVTYLVVFRTRLSCDQHAT